MSKDFKNLTSQHKIETHGYTDASVNAGLTGKYYIAIKTNAQSKIEGARTEFGYWQSQGTDIKCHSDNIYIVLAAIKIKIPI
jgi:hypothetical protein